MSHQVNITFRPALSSAKLLLADVMVDGVLTIVSSSIEPDGGSLEIVIPDDPNQRRANLVRELFLHMATAQRLNASEVSIRAVMLLEAANELATFMIDSGMGG